jgi:hypothetical protein
VLRPLDYLPYDKAEAIKELEQRYGWRYYGAKRYESVWTKFFQGYYLPTRFGYDKRLAHLSSLVVAGQLSREAALAELARDHYPADELRRDRTFVIKKLGLSEAEFDQLLQAPRRSHGEYPSNARLVRVLRGLLRRMPFLKRLRRRSNA